MNRSEGVNVAVGALLVGIAAVILGLLAPLTAAIVGAICFVIGAYLIVGGVYMGWPSLSTATDRIFRPRLENQEAEAVRIMDNSVVFRVSIENTGRGNVDDAMVVVIVPDFVRSLKRCAADGLVGKPEHAGSFWDQGERFWNGNISFPGRMVRLAFFRATMPTIRDLQVKVRVFSPVLDDPLPDFSLDVSVADLVSPKATAEVVP